MSVRRYPAYKPSGIDWAGYIPSDWNTAPLKRVITFTTGWTPPTGRDEFYVGDNAWATIRDMSSKILTVTEKQVSDEAVIAARMKPSPAGSLLFSFKLSIGQVAFAGSDLFTNEAIATFLPSENVDLDFAYYAFPVFVVQNAAENIYGAKLLNQELIRNAKLILPSLPEQRAIAAFLDRETAKIDALIAEQERLIALLQEKRQAVISQAVTKGLDPTVPMKDSGVEQMAKIPASWKIVRLKQLILQGSSISYGIVQPGEPLDAGVPFIQTTNISSGDFDPDNLQKTTAEIAALYPRSKLVGGEVILGIRASIGAAYVVPNSLAGTNLSRGIARIEPGNQVTSQFLVCFLRSPAVKSYWEASKQGSTFNEVSIDTVRHLPVAVPPLSEQEAIVRFIDMNCRNIDRLRDDAGQAVLLLRERRAALISAAVTGKIDVREAVGAKPAEAA